MKKIEHEIIFHIDDKNTINYNIDKALNLLHSISDECDIEREVKEFHSTYFSMVNDINITKSELTLFYWLDIFPFMTLLGINEKVIKD